MSDKMSLYEEYCKCKKIITEQENQANKLEDQLRDKIENQLKEIINYDFKVLIYFDLKKLSYKFIKKKKDIGFVVI